MSSRNPHYLIRKEIKNDSKESSKLPITSSPKPSTSGIQIKNLAVPQSTDTSDAEMDDTSSEAWCVCNLHSPEGLKDCPYLVIVKWVKCDNPTCTQWTHVKFCTAHFCVLIVRYRTSVTNFNLYKCLFCI